MSSTHTIKKKIFSLQLSLYLCHNLSINEIFALYLASFDRYFITNMSLSI